MKDFTVFYNIYHQTMRGCSFSVQNYKKIITKNADEIKNELEKIGVFGADIFCVLNGHHDNVLGD